MCGPSRCDKSYCSWSEKFRAECEAREVMRWPKDRRTEYYAGVRAKRGEAAAQELIAEVNRHYR